MTCSHPALVQDISPAGNHISCQDCRADLGPPPYGDGCECRALRSGTLIGCTLHRVVERYEMRPAVMPERARTIVRRV